ncbi:hypothetical protein cce_3341 [Crocosphaera subtropica ATCC 51142]|uniref:Uncharacterized protein n=1 Tax=Crocosphaera subtropica (strain ATCC 51142 / BH68) TaxID=43989 RepID=B1WYA5_CROS5|nr:hypothetical protein cce_3341 [Crocosphaera subtropica ATCC 51142]
MIGSVILTKKLRVFTYGEPLGLSVTPVSPIICYNLA